MRLCESPACAQESPLPSVRQLSTHPKSLWPRGRTLQPITDATANADKLFADLLDLRNIEIDRNRPSVGCPVVCGFRCQGIGDSIRRRVSQKRLDKRAVDISTAAVSSK